MRHALAERTNPLASDVSDALELLVKRNGSPPLAFKIPQVVDTLIEIVHMEDDGTIGYVMPIVRASLGDKFYNRLKSSISFQAGYKQFERRTSFPVVPVAEFFFSGELGNGGVANLLENMSDFEIRSCLPGRGHKIAADEERPEDGDRLVAGTISGVVIFPANSTSALLRKWLERRANMANGSVKSFLSSAERAAPGRVLTLKDTLQPALMRALPPHKKK